MGFWDRFRGTTDDEEGPTYSDLLRSAAGIGTA